MRFLPCAHSVPQTGVAFGRNVNDGSPLHLPPMPRHAGSDREAQVDREECLTRVRLAVNEDERADRANALDEVCETRLVENRFIVEKLEPAARWSSGGHDRCSSSVAGAAG